MNRNLALTITGCLAFMALLVGLAAKRFMTPDHMSREQLSNNNFFLQQAPQSLQEFTLVDHGGAEFTKENLRGHWTLAFFGFTSCPDICPTTMATLSEFSGRLEDTRFADDTRVVMVSVDPRRDTPEKMKNYVEYFDQDFTGVTGEYIKLFNLAREVNIAFGYEETDSQAEKETAGDYLVNHSPQIILINPQAQYHGFFKPPHKPEQMETTYRAVRQRYEAR